ncbi:ArnT family glycosyltransferase [Chloroflexota bacterium]
MLELNFERSFFDRKFPLGLTPAWITVLFLMGVSAFLHLVNIDSIGDANTYYTAAVESMLQSWENFFFVAAEPGGSVTVDKPPLGLWTEAAFAFVLGVNGVAVSLPNIIAGILSVPLIYFLVRRCFGTLAGVAAACVLVFTPVMLATDRNNTMDGMLTFALMLAAWAFMIAVETDKLGYLFVGGVIVGLAFNIKMLQAFLPLPAFYAFYFLSSRRSWVRKAIDLTITSILLLVVSLSWAIVVDSLPADSHPYIGSSENNTVMELIIGHNGSSRLFGRGGSGPRQAPSNQPQAIVGGKNPPPQAVGGGQPQPQSRSGALLFGVGGTPGVPFAGVGGGVQPRPGAPMGDGGP